MPRKRKATEQPMGEGQDAARRARLLDSDDNLTFSGDVFLTKSKEIASAQATAITAAAQTSTTDDIRIAMFTDASRPSVLGPAPGGYSIVFDNFFAGTPYYGQHLEMGWFMPEMEDTTVGEGLGIAQAFEVARQYLNSCSASENMRTVKISILSDAYTVIDMIDDRVPRKRIHARVVSLIRQKSHELRLVSGFNVTVELRWVPGHFDIRGNDHADHTAVRARELQRNVFAVGLVEKEIHAGDPRMPLGLHLQLENEVSRRPRMLRLPRTPWEPTLPRLLTMEPGRRLTLMPADELLIAIQLEEDFQQCENYRHQEIVDMRHQEIVDMDSIRLQLEEDFQQWEAHRHQESVNMEFIYLQLQEEGQRWSIYEDQELALREQHEPLFSRAMDVDESLDEEMVQAAVDRQLVGELKEASNRSMTPLGVPLLLVAS